jgi:hypothetical protein
MTNNLSFQAFVSVCFAVILWLLRRKLFPPRPRVEAEPHRRTPVEDQFLLQYILEKERNPDYPDFPR